MKRQAIQGSRGYQRANYRDLVRPAVNEYNNPVSRSAAYRREFYRPRRWGQRGAATTDLDCLAKAARAAGRGFTFARANRTGKMYVVPLFGPV